MYDINVTFEIGRFKILLNIHIGFTDWYSDSHSDLIFRLDLHIDIQISY